MNTDQTQPLDYERPARKPRLRGLRFVLSVTVGVPVLGVLYCHIAIPYCKAITRGLIFHVPGQPPHPYLYWVYDFPQAVVAWAMFAISALAFVMVAFTVWKPKLLLTIPLALLAWLYFYWACFDLWCDLDP